MIQWLGTVDPSAVEQQWMALVERADVSPAEMAAYESVLAELCRRGQNELAETLAWTGIEAVSERVAPAEALQVARPFLLTVGESAELRAQVLSLYRETYADRTGIEALLEEAGLGGGRPVRRALRTLDVCLSLSPGDYVVSRDSHETARVERLDETNWTFALSGTNGRVTLPAVRLADEFRTARPDEFAVMRRFAREELIRRLWDDPASAVTELCRQHGGRIDSDTLSSLLIPDLVSAEEWKKWWTKARAAVRRSPWLATSMRKSGVPATIELLDRPVTVHDTFDADVSRAGGPADACERIGSYLRACRAEGETPVEDILRKCRAQVLGAARASSAGRPADAAAWWAALRWMSDAAGIYDGTDEAVAFFRELSDPATVLAGIEHESLLEAACACIVEARPRDAQEILLASLPRFPMGMCDRMADRLAAAASETTAQLPTPSPSFEPVVQTILGSPVEHFEALLWLWNGPTCGAVGEVSAVAVLSRIVRVLEHCRVGDGVSKKKAKQYAARAKSVLSARDYERFRRSLDAMDPAMGRALQRQIDRLDNLGRVVRSDLLRLLRRRFPLTERPREQRPWEREDVLFVTEAGLARKQQELDHHVNVKMRQNAMAIGRAAEHGDLSENSEYRFALEERDLLRARLAQMNAELAAARVLSPEDVPTDHVGIGTKAVFERVADGARFEMTIVGPWEADAEKRRYNYKAPLCQRVLGKRIGDLVEFDHTQASGTYRIADIENALSPAGADRGAAEDSRGGPGS